MKNLLSGIAGFVIFIVVTAVGILIASVIIAGGAMISSLVLPWLQVAALVAFSICFFILGPMAMTAQARPYAGVALNVSAYVFGLLLWVWTFLYIYVVWGFLGILIGCFIGGVGVVPMGILAAALRGEWLLVVQFGGLILLAFGTGAIGTHLIEAEASIPAPTS